MCEFYAYFQPELHQRGFEGMFSAKSRARTMRERDRKSVDGCAIFFRCDVFEKQKEVIFFPTILRSCVLCLGSLVQAGCGANPSLQPMSNRGGGLTLLRSLFRRCWSSLNDSQRSLDQGRPTF
jgi:hypothetical protein